MDIQKARQLHALRGIQPPTVIRLPPMYGTPFGQYPQIEDVTFRGDEPQTWAQGAGLDSLYTALPYVNPVIDQMVKDAEGSYGGATQQLDQLPQGPMGLFQPVQRRGQEGDIQGGGGSNTLAGGTRSRYTLTPADVQAVNNTAARLGIKPADLIAVMHYETIGTMNPTIKGGKGGRYQGLIQFGPSERRAYGYDADASFAEQVEGPVYRYLKDRGLPYGATLGTIYRTVNGGKPTANLNWKDGPIVNGVRTGRTIRQHIQAITANNLPQAEMLIANVGPLGPNTEAIMDVAARNPPTGAEQGPPSPLQGFLPPAMNVAPAQAAISDMLGQPGDLTADQIDELTRTDVAGNYLNQPQSQPLQLPPQWDAATGFPPPPPRRPGPGGALGVDLGMQPAGMPLPPSRPGSFDWLGGGAPPAALVPPPGISPLRPAFGGPGDRRPQPPTPPSRAQGIPLPPLRPGNFDYMGGGAPAAAGLPLPPSRPMGMPPSGPQRADDSRVAAIQSIVDQGITDPNEIWGYLNMDRDGNRVGDITPAEIQAVLSRGQRNAPDAQSAIADAFGPGVPFMPPSAPPGGVGAFSPPGTPSDLVPFLPPVRGPASPAIAPPLERANRRIIAGGQGGPVIPITPDEMRSSLANANANTERSLGMGGLGTPETAMSLDRTFPPPRPSWDQLQSESDSRLLASDIARTRGMMERSMRPLPSFDTPPPSGGPDFASANPSPLLPPTWAPTTSFPGETLATGPNEEPVSSVPPTPPVTARPMPSYPLQFGAGGWQNATPMPPGSEGDALARAYGSQPPAPISMPDFNQRFDPSPISRADFDARFGPTAPTKATGEDIILPGTVPGASPEMPPDEPLIPSPDPIEMAIASAPINERYLRRTDPNRPSFLSRLLPGGGNGFLGNFLGSFGTPPSFTAYGPQNEGWMNGRMNTGMGGTIRTSGKTPSGTPWSTGTSNALGGSNALRWTGSNGQTITAYTDPNTGQTFHSFS